MKDIIKVYENLKNSNSNIIYIFKYENTYHVVNVDALLFIEWFSFKINRFQGLKTCQIPNHMIETVFNDLRSNNIKYQIIDDNHNFQNEDISPEVEENIIEKPLEIAKKKENKIRVQINFKKSFQGMIALLMISSLVYLFIFSPFKWFYILSASMEPVILVDDLVIINQNYEIDELKKGQIIAFMADINRIGRRDVVVHYVFSNHENELGQREIKTKPAVSDKIDNWTLNETDILGIYVFRIPYVGIFLRFLSSDIGRIVVIANLSIIILIVVGKKRAKVVQK